MNDNRMITVSAVYLKLFGLERGMPDRGHSSGERGENSHLWKQVGIYSWN